MLRNCVGLTLMALLACQPATGAPAPPGASSPATPDAATSPATSAGASARKVSADKFVPLSDDGYGAYKYAPEAPHIGEQAPAIEAVLASGEPFVLADALADQRVLILFYRGDW